MKRFSKLYFLSSSYSLVMSNNYIVDSDTDDEGVIRQKITVAWAELEQISGEIQRQEKVYRIREGRLAGVKSVFVNFGFNKFTRNAKHFFAEGSYNGCGLCVRNCPAYVITSRDGKPVWAAQCYQYLRCINECPRQAIQCGKSMAVRRRYTILGICPRMSNSEVRTSMNLLSKGSNKLQLGEQQ